MRFLYLDSSVVVQNLNQIIARMLVFGVNSIILGLARTLVKRYRIVPGLRSMDAIHLATANIMREISQNSEEFYLEYITADKKQHQAFTLEGYPGMLLL